MNRLWFGMVWLAGFTMALPGAAVAADAANGSPISVCMLAEWDASMAGREVLLRANYSTDFMHGSHLESPDCPNFSLALDIDDPDSSSAERASVSAFDETISRYRDYYDGKDLWVVVRGKFAWLPARVINADLAPRKQLTIPARGAIRLRQVIEYGKPPASR